MSVRYCTCGAQLARDNPGGRCSPCHAASRPGGEKTTPQMPPGFWDEVAISEALRSRHMGQVIHAWRTHPLHGRSQFPQESVAAWGGITQGQLSRLENGRPITDLGRLIAWAQMLRIPADRLWFSLPDELDRNRGELTSGDWVRGGAADVRHRRGPVRGFGAHTIGSGLVGPGLAGVGGVVGGADA